MYDRILVATDGSEHAEEATRHAATVASATGATLHALFVVDTRTAYDNALVDPDELREHLVSIGGEALDTVEAIATEHDVPVVTSSTEGDPGDEILSYVDENDVQFVFMGEQGHAAFKTVLLGSTAERVLYHAPVPVAIV